MRINKSARLVKSRPARPVKATNKRAAALQRRPLIFCLTAELALFAAFAAFPVGAQVLDDSANVKILSAQSQTLLINHSYFEDMLQGYGLPLSEDDVREEYLQDCGSVSIGNNFASNQIGSDITVIIVGDVLNVGNSCGGP